MKDLPEFDVLREMAQNNPEQLEQLRVEMCDQLIQEAPAHVRRRLRGLQFQIDMERRRAGSAMDSCLRISKMMHDSLYTLGQTLNAAAGTEYDEDLLETRVGDSATVLSFPLGLKQRA